MKRILFSALTLLVILSACGTTTTTPMVPTQTPSHQPTETIMPPTSTPELTATPITTVILKRGVNMGNMLEAPNEGEWGLIVQEEYFDLIKQAGFDFVRLPVKWSGHAAESAPYTIDPTFFARIDEVLRWAMTRNLAVILDFHNYDEMNSNPWGHQERFLGIWKQIAEHYKEYPPSLLFELLNEPNTAIDATMWNGYLVDALHIVRETNSTRDVVVGPVNWNAYSWISTLDIPDDPHMIVTFHYYEPFHFTHQGAEWVGDESQQWLGTEWGSDAEKAEVTANFDAVSDWSQRHSNVRILLGEFGAYSKAPQDSRVRWTKFVREQAEAHGFAWAYWEFGSGFGAYDPDAKVWREDLLKALIP